MSTFEELYGRRCRSPFGWYDALLVRGLVYESLEKVWIKKVRLKMAQCRQKHYSDNLKRDLELEVTDWV